MDATLEQRKEAALALLSGMLTSVLQGDFPVTNRLSAQPASALDALLAKPTTATKPRANERDVFRVDINDLDLDPDSESEASSNDDRPIRNPRQLKSELRRLKTLVRRANRRTARRATRIAKHLDPSQAAAVFESLGPLVTPLLAPQHAAEDALNESMTVAAPLEGEIAEASDSASLNVEAINSPFSSVPSRAPDYALDSSRSSPTTSTHSSDITVEGTPWLCKPCNSSFAHLDDYRSHKFDNRYHEQNVADYKRLRPSYREDEDDAGQIPENDPAEHYCRDCDFRTQTYGNYRRHLRRQEHVRNVARRLQRKSAVVKEVTKVPGRKGRKPQQYCGDCDSWCGGDNWARHLRGPTHMDNVAKNNQGEEWIREEEEEMETVEELAELVDVPSEILQYYCKVCDYGTPHAGNWRRHEGCQMHRDNIAEKGPCDEQVRRNSRVAEISRMRARQEHYCRDCDKSYNTQNWSRHLVGSVHARNVLNNTHRNKRIALPTPPSSIVETEGLETLPQELPERYCGACDIYPGVRWARHLASSSHVLNAIRFSQRSRCVADDEDVTDDEDAADENGLMTGVESVFDDEVMKLVEKVQMQVKEMEKHEHYCEDCDCEYSGIEWDRHLASDEHVENVERSMLWDGVQCDEDEGEDEQIFSHALADTTTSTSTPFSSHPPPSTPAYSECYIDGASPPPSPPPSTRPLGKQDWYCDMCDANVTVESTWAIGEHMAKHQQDMYEKWKVKSFGLSNRFEVEVYVRRKEEKEEEAWIQQLKEATCRNT